MRPGTEQAAYAESELTEDNQRIENGYNTGAAWRNL